MKADVIIIGSGIAALTAADLLSKHKNVIIFTKSEAEDSNSYYAQGGIAAAVHPDDSWQAHLADTLAAGCGHADEQHAQLFLRHGPASLQQLIRRGMAFDLGHDGKLDLAKEGAHQRRRILHSGGDATGKNLVAFMMEQIHRAENICIREQEMAVDLLVDEGRCQGVLVKDAAGLIQVWQADAVILATGGCGSLFSCTSNHPNMTGDGMAMAFRAGAALADLEFIQFHPTILHENGAGIGLVSEAVRGEGAVLRDESGRPIMQGKHALEDLAPRDIVARQIFRERRSGRQVFLDVSPVPNFAERFPTIAAMAHAAGVNLKTGLLPVMPGAHFLMGGVLADGAGTTSLPGLYAVGETACTGVHGANRIASNSLLEGLVFGELTAKAILSGLNSKSSRPDSRSASLPKTGQRPIMLPAQKEIKKRMMQDCGVERSGSGLASLIAWLESYHFLDADLTSCTKEEIETINMLTTSWLIVSSAIRRTESRGGHYRSDFPETQEIWELKKVIRKASEHARHDLQTNA